MNTQQITDILEFYKTPCLINRINDSDNYIDYYLTPCNGTTIRKLQTREKDYSLMLGSDARIILENNSLILRLKKNNRIFYNYFSYYDNFTLNPGNIAIGINPAGEYIQTNLFNLPHLLVAGSTGSGKSVFLHNAIISLMTCGNVCFRLIDLKRVELSIYNGLSCMVSDCITNAMDAECVLHEEVEEMQNRYKLMEQYKVNHYSLLPDDKKLLARVIIIDELADLLMNREIRKSVENSIVRIAQLGRAAGIHLILATQRPDRNVITGLIKANIPGKIAFTVSNRYDSQVIGIQDAEKLSGKGDAIFTEPGKEPQHLQSFYTSPDEVNLFISQVKQNQKPQKKYLFDDRPNTVQSLKGFFKMVFSF